MADGHESSRLVTARLRRDDAPGAAGAWWAAGGAAAAATPAMVVAERRLELEAELDSAAGEGFDLVNSFTVDDNVYLVLRRVVP